MSIEGLHAMIRKTEAELASPLTKLASRFAALTAQRLGSIRCMAWSEFENIDWDGYLAEQLGKRGLAYLHCVEPGDPRGDPFDRIVDPQVVRKAFGDNYIANGSYTGPRACAELDAGEIDAASFVRLFIANPDLPRRLAEDLPMNPLNTARIYSGGGDGFIDYPFAD